MKLYFIQPVFLHRLVCTSPGLEAVMPRRTRGHPYLLGLFWRAASLKNVMKATDLQKRKFTFTPKTQN